MAGRGWLESSLDRSSKLGLEVLQRARRRSETWKSVRSSHRDDAGTEKHTEVLEHPAACMTLDNAFAKIVECMSETSDQCKRSFVRGVETEMIEGLSELEDFLIEVSPGTYAITAAMQEAGPQTRVVRINAGESMRLTFNL